MIPCSSTVVFVPLLKRVTIKKNKYLKRRTVIVENGSHFWLKTQFTFLASAI